MYAYLGIQGLERGCGVDTAHAAESARIRILVVDGDPCAREAAINELRRWGCSVESAEDGLQALDHLQRSRFAVVVIDIQMRHTDGIALLREIRRKGYAQVVVQALRMDSSLWDLLCCVGVSGVFVKGSPSEELIRLVEEAAQV
jgi:two-component system, response regulator